MKLRSILLSLMAIALVGMSSCGKNNDDDDDDNNGNPTPVVERMLSKSTTTIPMQGDQISDYHYIAGTIKLDYIEQSAGGVITYQDFVWTGDKVSEIVRYSDAAMTTALTKILYVYNGAELDEGYEIDMQSMDTIFYSYEYTAGKITKIMKIAAGEKSYGEYVWTGDNLASSKDYIQQPGGTVELQTQMTFTYDDKINPILKMNVPDSDVLNGSANNPLSMIIQDANGGEVGTFANTYTYDQNMPTNIEMAGMVMGMPMTIMVQYEYVDITL